MNWNGNGTLASLNIVDGFNSGGSHTCTFSYDDLLRLVTDDCGSVWSQTFSYDQYDNISKSGSSSWLPGYNAKNQYTTIGATYDLSGNLTYDSFNTYTWDSYGKVNSIKSGTAAAVCGSSGTCITYDALGRAVEKSVNATYTEILYGPAGQTALMNGQVPVNLFVPAPGGSTVITNGTNESTRYYEHSDWLGTSRLETNIKARTVMYDRAFAPYGEMYAMFGSNNLPNFTGDRQNLFSGLFDTPNREQSPTQGRWISPDPSGDGWNLYAYPTNPNSDTDPTGLWSMPSFAWGVLHSCGGFNNCFFEGDANYFPDPLQNLADRGVNPQFIQQIGAPPDPLLQVMNRINAVLMAPFAPVLRPALLEAYYVFRAVDRGIQTSEQVAKSIDWFNKYLGMEESHCSRGSDCINAIGMAGSMILADVFSGGLAEEGAAGPRLARAAEELHHLLPRQFRKLFASVGLDIEEYVIRLTREEHRLKPSGLHTGTENWNKIWKQFFKENPNFTREDVLNQLERMMESFGVRRDPI